MPRVLELTPGASLCARAQGDGGFDEGWGVGEMLCQEMILQNFFIFVE